MLLGFMLTGLKLGFGVGCIALGVATIVDVGGALKKEEKKEKVDEKKEDCSSCPDNYVCGDNEPVPCNDNEG